MFSANKAFPLEELVGHQNKIKFRQAYVVVVPRGGPRATQTVETHPIKSVPNVDPLEIYEGPPLPYSC